MKSLFFSSTVNMNYKEVLEEILFFNINQQKYVNDISKSVNKFGSPKLIVEERDIKIIIPGLEGIQTLFVFDSSEDDASLLGVIIYYRMSTEEIAIIHIAVINECSCDGEYRYEYVTLRLINKLREDLRRIKGIKYLRIFYEGDFNRYIKINLKD